MVCGPEAPGHTLNRLGLPCIEERDCSIDICQRPLVSFCSFLPSLLQLVWNLLPLLRHLAPYMLPLRFASAPTCLLHVAPAAHTSFLVSASCAPLWGTVRSPVQSEAQRCAVLPPAHFYGDSPFRPAALTHAPKQAPRGACTNSSPKSARFWHDFERTVLAI